MQQDDISQLSIGIAGYGKVGQTRHEVLRQLPGIRVLGVADINAAVAPVDAPFFKDWRALLEEPLDALFVCTTNDLIPEITVAALSKGVHCFSEKPPGRTLEDVHAMQLAEKAKTGTKLQFGFNHRYHGSVQDAYELLQDGELGRLLWMRGVYGKAGGPGYDKNWRNDPALSGGGILIDQGIHMLDLFNYFAGEFTEVQSMVGQSFWKVPVEDNAFALMRTRDGVVASLHSSATQWQHTFRLELGLERGYITLQGILSSTRSYGQETLTVARYQTDSEGYPVPNPDASTLNYFRDFSWKHEVEAFLQAIRYKQPVAMGHSGDAEAVMRLVERIYASDPAFVAAKSGSKLAKPA